MAYFMQRGGEHPLISILLFSAACIVAHGAPLLTCVGSVEWGNCTEGSNVGFRHPELDVVEAQRVDENSAGIVIDGWLQDWSEQKESRRYLEPEFAMLNGDIANFESLDPAKVWGGRSDFSVHSFRLKWDSEYLYLAVEVLDDTWEPIPVGTRCHTNGLQLAFEVGGVDATDLDGNSALGLVQARRSKDFKISRSVLINVGMSAFELQCDCSDCPDLKTSGTGGTCCVDYEYHGPASPLHGNEFAKRLRAAGRRDGATNITTWEVAVHRDDLMYPDWPTRQPSGLSRWVPGTTIGFSFVANEGLEARPVSEPSQSAPEQAAWSGYYPHAILYGWNAGNKEPWKMGRVKLTDDGLPTVVAGVVVSTHHECSGSSADSNTGDASFVNQDDYVMNLTALLELPFGDSALQDGRLVAEVAKQPKFGYLSGLTTIDDAADSGPRILKSFSHQQAPGLKNMFTSSVNAKCHNCCRTMQHRPGMDDCMKLPSYFCYDCPRAAVNAEGPPDAIEIDRDSSIALDLSWVPECSDCGIQWVVLQFNTGSYITGINIYDTGRKGAIVRVEGLGGPLHAVDHIVEGEGGMPGSPWVLLWEARGDSADALLSYSEDGRVFSPPLTCQSHALITNLRIFVDTSGGTPAGIDAVELVGLARPPAGMLRVTDGSSLLHYHPAPGIHTNSSTAAAVEFVELRSLLSCNSAYSAGATELLTVPMPSTRPTNPLQASVWGEPWQLSLRPFQRVQLLVDPFPVLQHAEELLGPGARVMIDRARIIQEHISTSRTTWFRSFAETDEAAIPRDELLTPLSVSSDGRIELFVELRDPVIELLLWIQTSVGATYRVKLLLQPVCPEDTPRVNFKSERCVKDSAVNLPIIIVSMLCIGAFLITLAALLAWRNLHLTKRVEHLTRGVKFDLESPLVKVIDFLQQFESSIALVIRGPRKDDAARLRQTLIANMHRLVSPNIAEQLRRNPLLDTAIARYISAVMLDESSSHSKSVFDLDAGSDALSMPPDNSVAGEDSFGTGTALTILEESYMLLRSPSSSLLRQSVHFPKDAEEKAPPLQLSLSVPPDCRIAADFFLDVITDKSALRDVEFPLVTVVRQSLQSLALDDLLVPSGSLRKCDAFLQAIERGYSTVGYHCALHAADVTNKFATLLAKSGIATALDTHQHRMQMLASVIAAAIHDFEHPLVSNTFLCHKESPVAIGWNEQAVLENHSVFVALKMIQTEPAYGFIEARKDRAEFRRTAISMVLATDMQRHFDLLTQFQVMVAKNESLAHMNSREKWCAMDAKHRLIVLQLAIKVCDVGHCATTMEQHLAWVQRLQGELFAQGDLERRSKQDISPLCDRYSPSGSVMAPSNQIGFFDMIVLPLIRTWVEVFPECKALQLQAEANYNYWFSQLTMSMQQPTAPFCSSFASDEA